MTVDIAGLSADSRMTKVGGPIVYGVSVPDQGSNRVAGIRFLRLMFSSRGRRVLEAHGFSGIGLDEAAGGGRLPDDILEMLEQLVRTN